uniref:beta-1,4-galactosyltransferase galt-1-like n=1 Tax=Scatophagus argus TaxID=75038 RepID=UPI001ED8141A|nr:beta-1,4-galactosyltransferase galt-1-like [Scatophagus argus]
MAKVLECMFFSLILIFLIFVYTLSTPRTVRSIPQPRAAPNTCPSRISNETITPLDNTKHLLVSAFMDQRVKGFDIRIIGIFRRDSIQPLYCVFCCSGHISTTTRTTILQHTDNFGFPFTTTDVMCPIPQNCKATHVSLQTQQDRVKVFNQSWLPIRNQKGKEEKKFDFTVCVSTLFGDYNNVLQFAQTLEMYRLLGVDRVVIYNSSCGPDLDRLLQGYSQEGFVEMVPWPINKFLNPSHGWLFSRSGGDMHYHGQQATLNECIYRSMERSQYVLLNDIDEIIMPYHHNNLKLLMETLQHHHPNAGVFLIENFIFPKEHFEPNGKFNLSQWKGVPGVNILEHIYREELKANEYHRYKMIIQPRMVEQTSVHEPLKSFGEQYKVPVSFCRMIHIRGGTPPLLPVRELIEDKRLWDFTENLTVNVDKALERAGLLS